MEEASCVLLQEGEGGKREAQVVPACKVPRAPAVMDIEKASRQAQV